MEASYEEIKEEINVESEEEDNAEVVRSGRLVGSMEQLVAEGIVR